MSRKEDLEQHILESYRLIVQCENIVRDSDRPKEISRSQRVIAEQWELIKGYLDEYLPLCRRLSLSVPTKVLEVANRFPETGVLKPDQQVSEQKGKGDGLVSNQVFSGVRCRWAVLVGVTHYQDEGIGDLRVCASDVSAVHDLLIAQPDNTYDRQRTRLLVDEGGDDLPTRSKIIGAVTALAQSAEAEDLLMFYFSGHGIEVNGEAYLLPRDAEYAALANTSVPVALVKQLVIGSDAHIKVMVLDACHSGARIGKAAPIMTEDFIRRVFEEAEGMVTLSSCRQQQVSWEWQEQNRSVFTYYLLEGLEGAADSGNKKFVTANDLSRYVTSEVKAWAAKRGRVQSPTYEGATSGDVILAYL